MRLTRAREVAGLLPPEAEAHGLPLGLVAVNPEWVLEAASCWPRGRRWKHYRALSEDLSRRLGRERHRRVDEMAELLGHVEAPAGLVHFEVKARIALLLEELAESRHRDRDRDHDL